MLLPEEDAAGSEATSVHKAVPMSTPCPLLLGLVQLCAAALIDIDTKLSIAAVASSGTGIISVRRKAPKSPPLFRLLFLIVGLSGPCVGPSATQVVWYAELICRPMCRTDSIGTASNWTAER